MRRDALKPCPFCGGIKIDGMFIRDGWRVGCIECGAGVQAYHPEAHKRAAEKWNSRATAALSIEQTELVAWQHRIRPKGSDQWTEWREGQQHFTPDAPVEYEERPLYAHPPVSALVNAQADADVVEIPEGLVKRCAEIIAWKRTGKLPGDELRNLGKSIADRLGGSLFIDNGLNQAELQTIDEALRLVVSLRPAEVGSATVSKGAE